MANEKNIVTKIYRVSIEGADSLVQRMEGLNTSIDKYKLAIREAKKEKLTDKADLDKQQQLNKVIAESEGEIKRLTAERKIAGKELQAYVTQQQKAAEATLKEQQAIKALPGSYNALYAEYKKLNTELRATPNTAPNFAALDAQVKGLKTRVDEFNRSFTKDGTLVGEYTTGIINAFKQAGLDDLIKGQGDAVKREIDKLDVEFVQLQKELEQLGGVSDENFQQMEKQLIDNRQQSIKLTQELERVHTEIRGVGGIGTQVSDSLSRGFKGLAGNITQMAVGFFAFQNALSFVQGSFDEFTQAETNAIRLQNALKNFGKEKYFDELTQQANELASALGFVDNDDIVKAQEKLVTFGKLSVSQIKAALPTIIDLSANLGVSIPEATSIFLKAIEGSGKALKEYGINIKDGGTEAERFQLLQTELAKKVAGSADAMGKSAPGQVRKFKQELKDLQEEVGKRVLPALLAVGTFLIGLPWGTIAAAVAAVTAAFVFYRAQLLATAIIQGTLNTNTFAYWVLNNLRIAQQGILNGLQAAQNFLLATYTAIQLRANAATGFAAIVMRGLGVAIRFMTGPFGIAITLAAAFVTILGSMSANARNAGVAATGLARTQAEAAALSRVNAEIQERVAKTIGDQVAKIKTLTQVTTDQSISEQTRRKALDELIKISPSYRAALDGERIDIEKVTAASNALIESLQKQARATAVAELAKEKEKRKIELESAIAASFTEVRDSQGRVVGRELRNKDNSVIGAVKSLFTDNETGTLKKRRAELEQINADLGAIYGLVSTNADLQNALTDKSGLDKPKTPATTGTGGKPKTAKELRDEALKRVQEQLETQKVALEIARLQKTEFNGVQINDEQTYLRQLDGLTQRFADRKLAILKSAAVEERRQIAELNLEKIKSSTETNNKIFEIENEALKQRFENEKQLLQSQLDAVENDPTSNDLQKTQARIAFYQGFLSLQQQFNAGQEALEKSHAQKSVETERQRAEQIKQIRRSLAGEAAKVSLLDFEQQLKEAGEAFNKGQVQREEIRRKKLEEAQGDGAKIAKIENDNRALQLAQEAAYANIRLQIIRKMYEEGLISAETYYNALKDATDKGNAAVTETFKKFDLVAQFKDAFGLNLKTFEEGFADILQAAKNLGRELLNDIFENNKERINAEAQTRQDRLNIEEQLALDTAQSEAEKDSIRRQFAKKEKDLERQRNLELQANAIKKLEIETAVGVAKTLATYPFPLSLVMGALQFAAFLVQKSNIRKQTFAQGGVVPTNTGGRITGPSHAGGGVPFNYEAEGDELAIINKRSARSNRVYQVIGTASQIASAINEVGGGVRFAPGAKVKKFALGGVFNGAGVQAPVFIPANTGQQTNDNAEILDAVVASAEAIRSTNTRIDRLQVTLNPNDVRKENKQFEKQTELATL